MMTKKQDCRLHRHCQRRTIGAIQTHAYPLVILVDGGQSGTIFVAWDRSKVYHQEIPLPVQSLRIEKNL